MIINELDSIIMETLENHKGLNKSALARKLNIDRLGFECSLFAQFLLNLNKTSI